MVAAGCLCLPYGPAIEGVSPSWRVACVAPDGAGVVPEELPPPLPEGANDQPLPSAVVQKAGSMTSLFFHVTVC